MSIQRLVAILIAIAVLFAPAFTSAGMANAPAPNHHAQMQEKGHCDPASGEEQDKPVEMACCGATCMALAANSVTAALAKPLIGSLPVAALPAFRAGVPAELATPPPRAA